MLLQKNALSVDFATAPHNRSLDKPNEDRHLIDTERGIFIVLDGVTRVHKEYSEHPYKSAAGEVGDIFLKEVYDYITNHLSDPSPRDILEGAVRLANKKIKEYRKDRQVTAEKSHW